MPIFRFVVEGSDFRLPRSDDDDDEITGFFTTRKARAPDMRSAESLVLERLSKEWRDHTPTLSVVDAWRVGLVELKRRPNRGHAFFSDEYSRFAAAWLEAEVARAPKGAAIWQLAAQYVREEEGEEA